MPPGFRLAVAWVTNRPLEAERATVRLLPVPEPTLSVVVLAGHRATVALDTNLPLEAERLTDRAISNTPFVGDLDLPLVLAFTSPATLRVCSLT